MADKFTIHCDANKPTPEQFVAAYIVKQGNKLVHQLAEPIAAETSCEAEYDALLSAMTWCDTSKYEVCRFLCDSRFVVCGVNNAKIHSKDTLKGRQKTAKDFLEKWPKWVLEWIPREDNAQVDTLSRMNPSVSVETFKQI